MPPKNVKELKKKKEEEGQELTPVIFKTTPKKHSDELANDFIQKYGEKKYNKENNSFEFEKWEDAKDFFTKQAVEKKREFFAREATPEGKPKPEGRNFFSLGDGNMYDGNLHEIKAKLEKARDELGEGPGKEKYKQAINSFETLIHKEKLQEAKQNVVEERLDQAPTMQ